MAKRWMGSVVTRACERFVTRLPVEAADALVVDAIFLVVTSVVAGQAERFFGGSVVKGEVVEFLDERESIEAVEGVYKVSFLFVDNRVGGSDVFKVTVCLVGMVQGEEGATWLAVGEDGDFQLFII